MNWLSMGPGAAAALWAGLAAIALWLYLHHRRPIHRKVSTLRFWASVQAVSQPRRRKLREPLAFLAQILFLLLLILALANPRWGITFEGRSVVIVLDTSIWSQLRPAGETPWIDQERAQAQRIVDSLSPDDRVLLIPATADAPPLLPFTTDRAALRRAIALAPFSSSVADVPRALEMAKGALTGSRRALLVYVGPGMLDEQQAQALEKFRDTMESADAGQPQFLVRLAGDQIPIENRGIAHLSLRRDAVQPDHWHLFTQLKNYAGAATNVQLKLSINGQSLGERSVPLGGGQLSNVENEFTWSKGGLLQAEIDPPDALAADNRAVVNIPTFRIVRVALFTGNTPFATDMLGVLSSNPYLRTEILSPGMNPDISPDVAIYQGTSVPEQSSFNSIWFVGGPAGASSRPLRVTGWNSQHPVTRWVRTHDISVRNPAVLTVLPTDSVLAYTEGTPPKPLILAREQNGHRLLIIGFNPHDSNFPLESAFPLLMAGGMEWMTDSVDETANSLSTGELAVPGPATRIVSPSGRNVPFARKGGEVHLLATETGIYRVVGPNGETSVAVNTPLLPAQRMTLTSSESAEVYREPSQHAGWDIWRWLVILGIVALWLEWWLYYFTRERQRAAEVLETHGDDNFHDEDADLEKDEQFESHSEKLVT
jgi:Ca-activated chloride channel homolog